MGQFSVVTSKSEVRSLVYVLLRPYEVILNSSLPFSTGLYQPIGLLVLTSTACFNKTLI